MTRQLSRKRMATLYRARRRIRDLAAARLGQSQARVAAANAHITEQRRRLRELAIEVRQEMTAVRSAGQVELLADTLIEGASWVEAGTVDRDKVRNRLTTESETLRKTERELRTTERLVARADREFARAEATREQRLCDDLAGRIRRIK